MCLLSRNWLKGVYKVDISSLEATYGRNFDFLTITIAILMQIKKNVLHNQNQLIILFFFTLIGPNLEQIGFISLNFSGTT